MRGMIRVATGIVAAGFFALSVAQEAPMGGAAEMAGKEKKAFDDFQGKLKGKIVWSTSRASSKHDIWIMNADGSSPKPLTSSPNHVDWFSRFSPDGQTVLFTRSKMGWVNEMDAEIFDKWDLWTIKADGSDEKKVVESACWGTWRPGGDSVVFARGTKVFIKSLTDGNESEIFDAETHFKKKGAYAQQPQLSPNGSFLAITVRGTIRETGIYNRTTKTWSTTGGGCQISWFPDNKAVVRMNEGQGNGGTEVLKIPVDANGAPTVRITGLSIPKELRFMDIPGRRSHEYFPQIDRQKGQWMVWCATQVGHEHDIADYEVYVWDTTVDKEKGAIRLSFHSGNDRWPDIFIE